MFTLFLLLVKLIYMYFFKYTHDFEVSSIVIHKYHFNNFIINSFYMI